MLFVDWIMVIASLASVALLIQIVVTSRRSRKFYKADANRLAIRQRNGYICSSVVYAFIHYWCILFSILSTLIVLYVGCFEDTSEAGIKARMILYSALSLFTTICPYVVNLLKISRKYRSAFLIMDEALNKETSYADALCQCEKIISSGFDD